MGKLSELLNKAIEGFYKSTQTLWEHIENAGNPHRVTKEQVGLGNVSNTPAASQSEFNLHKAATVIAHPDKSVTTAKLADGTVTSAKLANSAVTAVKMATGAVTTGKIADGAVTATKISEAVPIAKGGTGATNADAARQALGAMSAKDGEKLAGNVTNIRNMDGGFAAGNGASAGEGAAVGRFAVTGFGFAGGYNAQTTIGGFPIDAVQLGTGVNPNAGTLQVYRYQLLDEWGNIPVERLGNAQILRRYGVRFEGSANSGETVTRIYDAAGLTAGVGTDTKVAVNDFDYIYPWSERKRCCGFFDETGKFIVNAYEGEPGYATDGTCGEVWVETPIFYYLHEYGSDGSEEISISPYPISGYKPSPIHINADGSLRQKAYTAAYPMGMADGMPTSRSGVHPVSSSLTTGIQNARKLGENYTITTTAEHYTKCLLMWVEFATRNIQSVMAGCSELSFSANSTVKVGQSEASSVIMSNTYAKKFIVGQFIGIGTVLGTTSIASKRKIISIDVYDSANSRITFDGPPVTTEVGNIVFSMPWITGTCDGVLTSSGSYISNSNGYYTCVYRGEETPFGSAFECISDLLLKRNGSGSADNPYTYDIYYLDNPTKFNAGTITDDYVKINYRLAQSNGFASKFGYDARYPFVRMPVSTGTSSTTYYADNYSRPLKDLTAAAVGGYYGEGVNCGISNWYCASVPGASNVYRNARLSYYQR